MLKTLLAAFTLVLLSCHNADKESIPPATGTAHLKATATADEEFSIDPKALTKDFTTWYNYTYYDIRLSQDFIGLSADSTVINKAEFLNALAAGRQVTFKVKTVGGRPVYRLFNIDPKEESILTASRQLASAELVHYKMEGTPIPDFHFTDLNGNEYTKASVKGKLLVVKCWFIHCVACVKEFPELNKLVAKNIHNPNVLFISLALDQKQDLQNFLKTKAFTYATVPNVEPYITSQLGVSEYPTHLLVDGNGKIVKVVNKIEDLLPFLALEKAKISG